MEHIIRKEVTPTSSQDWIYVLIASYFIICGILNINLYLIWITFTLKVKVYDLKDLYGSSAARIIYILLGILVLIYHFLIQPLFTFGLATML